VEGQRGQGGVEGRFLVIGVGNDLRSDDGAGLAVARAIAVLEIPGVRVMEHSGEGLALMDMWREAEAVWIADAVVSGSRAGTIHRFEAHRARVPADLFRATTHHVNIPEAVELARALGRLPRELTVHGIEGKDYKAGTSMSRPVAAAVRTVIQNIQKELNGHA
jgi:hydrogenase maturation protease